MNELAKAENFELAPLAPEALSESAAIIRMIGELALNPSVDIARVKELWAFKREVEEGIAKRAFAAAMSACKAELPQVIKNAENKDNKAKYATLDAIGDAIDGIVAKHGFYTSFNPAPCDKVGFQVIECTVGHSGAHERQFRAELPIDAAGAKGGINKTPIHAWKSTTTYARRTLTEMIFDVKSKTLSPDDDGNAAGRASADNDPSTIGMEKALELIAMAEKIHGKESVSATLPRFCKYYKIASLPDLPLRRLDEAVADLKRKD